MTIDDVLEKGTKSTIKSNIKSDVKSSIKSDKIRKDDDRVDKTRHEDKIKSKHKHDRREKDTKKAPPLAATGAEERMSSDYSD